MSRIRSQFHLLMILAVACTLLPANSAAGETWGERLGYGADTRVVVLAAFEMGLAWETNVAAEEALTKGELETATVLPTAPWFDDFAKFARQHPQYDIGVSMTLTAPYKDFRWRLLSGRKEVPTLVDADGDPWRRPMQFAAVASPEDIQKELHAQIAKARRAGIKISHLGSYDGACYMRPEFAEVFLNTAVKYWIPAEVIELTPDHIERFRREGFPLSPRMIDVIRGYPLPKADDIQFVPDGETYEEKRARLIKVIEGLEPGITLVKFNPAVESRGLKRLSSRWQQRVWDTQLLYDEEVDAAVKRRGIVRTNWREIMRRFEGEEPEVLKKGGVE